MNRAINKKQVGNRIKGIRLLKNETMEEMANAIGSNKSNVSRWERGLNVPNEATLERIAEHGNTSVEELLYGSSVRNYVINLLSNDEEYNYDDPIQKKATDDTISCFDDTNLTNEEMDIVNVYLQNLKYHEGNNGYRIYNKESYIEYLEILNHALNISLDEDVIRKEAEKQIQESERFKIKGYESPAMEEIINTYTNTHQMYIESNRRLINRLNRKE